MIIWFTGISGVGKTTIAKIIYKKIKKKIPNLVHIDGDQFRQIFKNDIGYSLKDRNTNAERIINFVKFLDKNNINSIISANLTSQKYRVYCKKNLKDYFEINIVTDLANLQKRGEKNIYNRKNKSNIVGFGIKNSINNTCILQINNNKSKKNFTDNANKIINLISKKL